MEGHIFQINYSEGGVPKLAIPRAYVTEQGVQGDRQRNRKVHGGPERALCLYSLEQILVLQKEGHPIYPGAIGENITLAGLPWKDLSPGTRLRLGDTVEIVITSYTVPCKNIQDVFVDGYFSRVSQKKYPGWARLYARVEQPGEIAIGAPVLVV